MTLNENPADDRTGGDPELRAARELETLEPATVLAELRGLRDHRGVRLDWLPTVVRLIAHRERLVALRALRTAAVEPELAGGPCASNGRLIPALEIVHAELRAQRFLWGHICEELLARVLAEEPPGADDTGEPEFRSPYGLLLDAEAQPPWSAEGEMMAPALAVPQPREELTPLIGAAMDRLAEIEAARLQYIDAFGCEHKAGECDIDIHVPHGQQDLARELEEEMADFPDAVEAFGDAVALAVARELRPALLIRR